MIRCSRLYLFERRGMSCWCCYSMKSIDSSTQKTPKVRERRRTDARIVAEPVGSVACQDDRRPCRGRVPGVAGVRACRADGCSSATNSLRAVCGRCKSHEKREADSIHAPHLSGGRSSQQHTRQGRGARGACVLCGAETNTGIFRLFVFMETQSFDILARLASISSESGLGALV